MSTAVQAVGPRRHGAADVVRRVAGDRTGSHEADLGVLLYRARNRLRECLEAKGIKSPT